MTDLERIAELLHGESTLALATTGLDGFPHIAPLFYVSGDNFALYWISSIDSLHSRNLSANRSASACIYRPTENWQEIRGAQMRGQAESVLDNSRARIVDRYRSRFRLGDEFGQMMARHELYRFEPAWIRYIDNSLGFGYKFEFSVRACPPT